MSECLINLYKHYLINLVLSCQSIKIISGCVVGSFYPECIQESLVNCSSFCDFSVLQVVPAIDHLTSNGAQFADGQVQQFDAVILATGYRSNVPQWLNVSCIYVFSSWCFASSSLRPTCSVSTAQSFLILLKQLKD